MIGIIHKAYFSFTGGLSRAGFCCRLGDEVASKDPIFLWVLSAATYTVRSLGNDPDLGRRKPGCEYDMKQASELHTGIARLIASA
ncbi:hypothetical protein DPMN_060773 [Dreissena polymorpha]|uniref:Uncharacterized protein n=1 Tax=Dreissena polymorpha TaxID=45954 RepID=A0A9D4C6I2_DREPO|nr:hypothetical protein DPMN_060773 [Dreissena polymorpha]